MSKWMSWRFHHSQHDDLNVSIVINGLGLLRAAVSPWPGWQWFATLWLTLSLLYEVDQYVSVFDTLVLDPMFDSVWRPKSEREENDAALQVYCPSTTQKDDKGEGVE